MAESEVQTWAKKYLEDEFGADIYIVKAPQGQYISRRGIPDYIMCIKGFFVGLEVKTEVGKLTKLQEYELTRINRAGGLSVTLYGKDIRKMEAIVKFIRERS